MSPTDHVDSLARELRGKLVEQRRAIAVSGTGKAPPLPDAVRDLVDTEAAVLSSPRRQQLADRVLRDTVGLGPLEALLRDPEVEEVMVNGHEEVWVERRGRLERTEVRFDGEPELRDVIERVLGPVGRRVDELSPMADGRLADGSRVNVVIPPLSVDGPAMSIRRFAGFRPSPEELLQRGDLRRGGPVAARRGGGEPAQPDRQRRDRLRQNDGPQRRLRVHRPVASGW